MDENKNNAISFADAHDVLSNPIKGDKGRKSAGRRVSFAATAKVRLFERPPGMEAEGGVQEEPGNEDQDNGNNRQNSSTISPLRAPGTPSSRLPQVLSPSSAEGPPSRIPLRSPLLKKSPISQSGSFEVDIVQEKEDNESLSSFTEDDPQNPDIQDDTMEFTTCIGGIAPSAAFQRLSEANSMDFTGCVGKILSDIGKPDVKENSKYDELENDTMDLTTCIGGLLENPVDMELTQVVSNNIKKSPMHPAVAALKLSSPSPFLVHSPLTPNKKSILLDSEMSFIDTVDRPDLIGSPMVIDKVASNIIGGHMEYHDMEKDKKEEDNLFRTFINTEPAVYSQPLSFNSQPAKANQDVKEFLSKAGIRFMDNLTSLGRRETTGRPRDSEVITPAKHRTLVSSVWPEQQVVEHRCAEMYSKIVQVKTDIMDAEADFQSSELMSTNVDSPEFDEVKQRMKTAKSVARLRARAEWYEWRAGVETGLNQLFSKGLVGLKQELSDVVQKETDVDAVGVPLVRLRDKLVSQLTVIEAEERARASIDWGQVSALQATCSELEQASRQLDAEMTALARQEEELRKKLASVQDERRTMSRLIDGLEIEKKQLCECSDLALKELKSKMALLEALHGWRLVSLKPSVMVIEYCRGKDRVQARLELGLEESNVIVPAVQLFCVQAHGVLKHAASVIKVEAGRGLLRTLLTLLTQLDRLHHIDRAIGGRCGMLANVDILDSEPCLKCTFFDQALRCKYAILLKIGTDRLELAQVVNEYGETPTDGRVRDSIDAANLGNRFLQLDTFIEHMKPH